MMRFKDKVLIKNLSECKKIFCPKTDKAFYKNRKRRILEHFLPQLQTTASIDLVPGSGSHS